MKYLSRVDTRKLMYVPVSPVGLLPRHQDRPPHVDSPKRSLPRSQLQVPFVRQALSPGSRQTDQQHLQQTQKKKARYFEVNLPTSKKKGRRVDEYQETQKRVRQQTKSQVERQRIRQYEQYQQQAELKRARQVQQYRQSYYAQRKWSKEHDVDLYRHSQCGKKYQRQIYVPKSQFIYKKGYRKDQCVSPRRAQNFEGVRAAKHWLEDREECRSGDKRHREANLGRTSSPAFKPEGTERRGRGDSHDKFPRQQRYRELDVEIKSRLLAFQEQQVRKVDRPTQKQEERRRPLYINLQQECKADEPEEPKTYRNELEVYCYSQTNSLLQSETQAKVSVGKNLPSQPPVGASEPSFLFFEQERKSLEQLKKLISSLRKNPLPQSPRLEPKPVSAPVSVPMTVTVTVPIPPLSRTAQLQRVKEQLRKSVEEEVRRSFNLRL